MGHQVLTFDDAREIKRLLWESVSQSLVATQFGITQTTVSRILNGTQWYDAPWPDQTTGAMSSSQRVIIHRGKYSGLRANALVQRLSKLPEVNLERISTALAEFSAEEDYKELEALKILSQETSDNPMAEAELQEPEFDEAAWEDLRKKAPRNNYIRAAKSPAHRLAVLTVFRSIPTSQWAEASTSKLIKAVRHQLGD